MTTYPALVEDRARLLEMLERLVTVELNSTPMLSTTYIEAKALLDKLKETS